MRSLLHRLVLIATLFIPAVALADGWDDALERQIEQSIQQPRIQETPYNILNYGAKPSATAVQNQKAIQRAIDKCSKQGGGRVIVPAGQTFKRGAIEMKSGVRLMVEEGAVLEFVFQPELYPIVETSWEGLDCYNLSPCIYAFKAHDIALSGKGTIDGGGTRETWWPWCGATKYGWKEGIVSQKLGGRARLLQNGEDGEPMTDSKGRPTAARTFTAKDGMRPQLIGFNQCQRILIEDVTLLRSPFWVIHPLKSTDVTVRGVHINNDGPNGDGCDPESCDRVLIEHCFFNTGDDCIAIKSGRNRDGRERAMPSQNIIIRHCEMKNGHGGVVIGSEISGGCRNVIAHDCVMDSPHLDRVLRIKTNSCRGGIIENIYVKDIEVGQCGESVLKINLDYEHNEICCRGNYPTVRNVLMENVTCQKSKYGVQIIGLDEDTYVHDITVRNCRFDGVQQGNTITGKTRNITFDRLFLNGSLVLQQFPYKHYSEWMAYSEMKRTPQSYLLDFSSRPKWSYVMGIELESILDTYLRYGDQRLLDYCQTYTDTMINVQGDIRGYQLEDYNLDNIRTGHFVARMYQHHPEPKNLLAMKQLMRQLQHQPRTEQDGVFWHKAIYSYQVWLDGIFMGLPYHVLTASMFLPKKEAQKVYDDAIHQILTTYQRTLDPATGLNRHAWDETREMFWADPQTGLSQHCWGRAQGWFTMALIELLDVLPSDHPRRSEVIDLLRKDLDAIIRWQDSTTGLWYQVMDSPPSSSPSPLSSRPSPQNYLESTCSSMFTYALLKAYRKGYVNETYREAGIKAYRGIIRQFIRINEDQTLSLTQCCSVAGLGPGVSPRVLKAAPNVKENKRRDGSFAYYLSEPIRDNDAKGIGPFIWASLEMEQLGYDIETVLHPIDRKAVVQRNNPIVTAADSLASLSVGNGHIATTVDVTGMQSYPEDYAQGVPLTTMSDWGWHSFPDTLGLRPSDSQRTLQFPHRDHPEVYAVEYKLGGRQQSATQYFRINPHRLNLGTIGLQLHTADNQPIPLSALTDIHQELHLYTGIIESSFSADGQPVHVTTACSQDRDAILYRITSPLLTDQRAQVILRFSYPTGKHSDDANDWTQPDRHHSRIVSLSSNSALIERTLDSTRYHLLLQWEGQATLNQQSSHIFLLTPKDSTLLLEAHYLSPRSSLPSSSPNTPFPAVFTQIPLSFWLSGGIVDFSRCTDPRAPELERRVIQSLYLTRINCTGDTPPQETGLTYNSWFGRPHLEMTWWHAVHFSLWNRQQYLAHLLEWYNQKAYPEARKIAERQGFKGVRWMKMTDPWAGEAPSNVGSFLIWQQPHYIYMAEEIYRHQPTADVLNRYAQQVEETAAFMADYAVLDPKTHLYHLKGVTAMQESMSKDFSYDHPFELSYWRYGLQMAQQWRTRRGLPRHPEWDDIIHHLAPLPQADSIYTAGLLLSTASHSLLPDSNQSHALLPQEAYSDHPAVLGACGLIPTNSSSYDPSTMLSTLRWVTQHWNWPTTWGWDYGMMAMAAARLGDPQTAIDLLLTPQTKNTYLVSGHNFQTSNRLRLYLPGNGALLTAIAMMCAGWDGCTTPHNPSFPQDGTWDVRWENLNRMQ